ncbi:MAG TPA: hypothetical protein VIJ87_17995 [Pyrinomonadaceae bacterium]
MALNFPSSPTVGDLYPTPAQVGVPQYRWDGTAWIAQAVANAPTYVLKAGDTMTGQLIINYVSPHLILQRTAVGELASVTSMIGALPRWDVAIGDTAPESGGNVGSNFGIHYFNDAGTYVGQALGISRADGLVILKGNPTGPLHAATKQYVDAAVSSFPVGTLMLFQQSAAPTGWTKQTTHNDKALRVVSGTAASGGTYTFSSMFAAVSTQGATLDGNTMAAHAHQTYGYTLNPGGGPGGFHHEPSDGNGLNAYGAVYDVSAGAGGAHAHGLNLSVLYVDLIIASKN